MNAVIRDVVGARGLRVVLALERVVLSSCPISRLTHFQVLR